MKTTFYINELTFRSPKPKIKYSAEFEKSFIIIMLYLVFFLQGILPGQDASVITNLPPAEVVTSAYDLAQSVIWLKADHISLSDTMFTDNGFPGYVCLRTKGRCVEIFKGDINSDSIYCVTNWIEYDEETIRYWQEQTEIILFLDTNEPYRECRRVVEAGQFVAQDSLIRIIRKLGQ